MSDTKDDTALKADVKAGRRASLTFVPAIARRVKHFDSASISDKAETPDAHQPHRDEDQQPARQPSPDLPDTIATAQEAHHDEDGFGGADIPDIPLRHRAASLRSVGSGLGMTSLATLERLMAAGGQQTPPFDFSKLRPEKRYEGQCDDLSLYPVSECSWESSLPDDEDHGLEPPLKRETCSTPNLQRQRVMSPPSRNGTPSQDQVYALPEMVFSGASTPLQREAPQPAAGPGLSAAFAPPALPAEQLAALPPLQAKGADYMDDLLLVGEDSIDSNNFDLVVPTSHAPVYSLERRSELLFSVEHLRVIFSDPTFLSRFITYVQTYRPHSMPLLGYTLDALKAIRAMEYTNQIISQNLHLDTKHHQHQNLAASLAVPELTRNESLRHNTAAALEALARDELPAYITHMWMEIVEASMKRKITGTMPAHLQNSSEGLAEVFVITDPSRPDNPIVFASEEFHRTTQYGPDYVLGRNCRFLQGPKTNPVSIQRLRDMLSQGKEHYETFLNYRRDGLPFMNLLMCTPLLDSKGAVRYFLGAQVDVSGLAKDCSGLESLRRLVDQDEEDQRRKERGEEVDGSGAGAAGDGLDIDGTPVGWANTTPAVKDPTRATDRRDGFRLLAEMLNREELETARRHGGSMLRSQQEQVNHYDGVSNWHKPRVVLHDQYELSPPSSPQHAYGSNGTSAGAGRQSVGVSKEMSDANGNITLNVSPSTPSRPSSSSPTLFSSGSASSLSAFGGLPRRGSPVVFENHLVVRPWPSLRILFASPPLRVPGTLQTHLMSRIGGSRRIHQELEHAFATGQSVTAKVKWLPSSGLRNAPVNNAVLSDASSGSTEGTSGTVGAGMAAGARETIGREGRPRWIHCTPLLAANGSVGVWVVVLVDEDSDNLLDESKRRRREVTVPVYADERTASRGVVPNGGHRGEYVSMRGVPMGLPQVGSKLGKSPDEMTLADYASMNRLPEDEELRRHVREMYDEAKRRERILTRDWERGWNEPRANDERDFWKSELGAKDSGPAGGATKVSNTNKTISGDINDASNTRTNASKNASNNPSANNNNNNSNNKTPSVAKKSVAHPTSADPPPSTSNGVKPSTSSSRVGDVRSRIGRRIAGTKK